MLFHRFFTLIWSRTQKNESKQRTPQNVAQLSLIGVRVYVMWFLVRVKNSSIVLFLPHCCYEKGGEKQHIKETSYLSRMSRSNPSLCFFFSDQYASYISLVSSSFRNSGFLLKMYIVWVRARVAFYYSLICGVYERLYITVKGLCSSMYSKWKLLVFT